MTEQFTLKRRENCETCGHSNWAERRLTIALKALKEIKNRPRPKNTTSHPGPLTAQDIANKALDDIIFIRVAQVTAEEADACFPEGKNTGTGKLDK